MCILPAMAGGLISPKTAGLSMISPAAGVIAAMSNKGKKKGKPAPVAQSTTTPGVVGPAPNQGY